MTLPDIRQYGHRIWRVTIVLTTIALLSFIFLAFQVVGIRHDAQAVLVRSNDISVSESRRVELDKQVTGLEADLRRVVGEHEALQQKNAALVARSELLERQAQDGERKAASLSC
ncbi:MAG: hypothetical protein WCF85_16630 [Rhodospirillaceae bacterium]